ncbi:MAG: M24 family metallopeptidase [Acidimicrobiales bacterium]
MKRGLVVLDPEELPLEELAGRATSLQGALRKQGLAAALIYGDVYRSGDITYLSNICIYWNEGILVVPASGKMAFLTKLSRRVHPWMHSTSVVEDLRSGPSLADLAEELLAGVAPGPIGLVERPWWPATLVGDLEGRLGGRELRDLGSRVRSARRSPSGAERALLARGGALTAAAVVSGLDGGLTNSERAGRVELTARRGGIEDVAVYCRGGGAETDTIEVVGEYRGYWTSAARVLTKGSPRWAASLEEAWRAGAAALRPGATCREVQDELSDALDGLAGSCSVDLLHHTDLETDGGFRRAEESSLRLEEGSVAALRMELDLPGGSRAVVCDTYEIGADGARCLTSAVPGPVVAL